MRLNLNLNNPFPFVDKLRDRFFVALSFSLFVFVFLSVFEPFGINNIIFYKRLFIFGYSFITFFVVGISFLLAPLLFKSKTEQWTVKRNIYFIIIQLVLISILNWIYTATIGKDIATREYSLFDFIFYTLSVGILPVIISTLLAERLLHQQNASNAKKITKQFNEQTDRTKSNDQKIIIGKKKEAFPIFTGTLVCVKSDGNYCEVYYLEQNQLKKKVLRFPLSEINQLTQVYANIKQAHRSYIVNFDYVNKVTGNARNYNLHIPLLNFSIPVSRNFPRELISNLNK